MDQVKYPAPMLESEHGPKHKWITPLNAEGWTDPVFSFWEMTAEYWTDRHFHAEWNYVVEGQLFIEVDGIKVELNAGDVGCVPAGRVGHYSAPKYAKMFAVYGPNPNGTKPTDMTYKKLSDGDSSPPKAWSLKTPGL
ncbi:cupin domain-containing protein [Acidisoma cellulosilytica]|uniref:Cupin domain-containing protein n=1 Tax=Acidisoma cellulosilyticum TaxID=2802395 RepID=A0A963Z7Z5_9PROT|nr:cupin domain-containing protein [Acidisoma cellulosilyticum]MCB8883730.1 cupin domain-containing protein [Acidisoma cellulosilyticum]